MKNVQLHQTFWFWLSIVAPITFSLALSSLICTGNDISISWKAGDLNELLKTFQIPLGILSLSIPFVAVTAAIHRSAQTARQIEAQQSQNNFINHFKHLEEFKKSFSDRAPIGWDNIETFHKDIFPNTIIGDFSARPLFQSPDKMFSDLFHQIERTPLDILTICRNSYQSILDKMDIDINIDSDKDIQPIHLLDLIQNLNLSITLTGLNHSPYKIRKEDRDQIEEYHNLAVTINNYSMNESLIRSAISSTEDSPLFDRINLNQNRLYAGLGLAYAWEKMMKSLWFTTIPKHTQDYLEKHVEPIYSMSLEQYVSAYDREDGTLMLDTE